MMDTGSRQRWKTTALLYYQVMLIYIQVCFFIALLSFIITPKRGRRSLRLKYVEPQAVELYKLRCSAANNVDRCTSYDVRCTMGNCRFAISDFRLKGKKTGTQMIMMIMIRTYLNHQSNLRSLSYLMRSSSRLRFPLHSDALPVRSYRIRIRWPGKDNRAPLRPAHRRASAAHRIRSWLLFLL
jgi:hypothetical protein